MAQDDAVDQRVVRIMLEQLGHDVDVAQDGRQAVRRVLAERYDRVLLDRVGPASQAALDPRGVAGLLALGAALGDVVDSYLQTVPDRLLVLWEAVQAQDVDATGRAAHSVRGMAAVLAAGRLEEICAQVELDAAAGRLPTAQSLLALHEEAERAGRALEALAAG